MASTNQIAERSSMDSSLETLLAISSAAGNSGAQERVNALREKLAAGQLYVAVLGQMKRGKSSLINALLRAVVLPVGVLPVTAIITEIRYGETPCSTVVYAVGGTREEVPVSTLPDYISEAKNPGNRKQVASVEITFPSPFLKNGIVLIDTPGIGSTHLHNTEVTENYLGKIDAGICVLSVDPPITETESSFIKNLKEDIPKLFFVLNKIDLVTSDEVSEVLHFLESELIRLRIASPEIYPLSALCDSGCKMQPADDVAANGLSCFEQRLQRFLMKEKQQVLVQSVAGDILEVARTLRFAASIGVRVMAMNMSELEQKRGALEALLKHSDVEMEELQVLLRKQSADILSGVESDLSTQAKANIPDVQKHLKSYVQSLSMAGRRLGATLEEFLLKEVEAVFMRWMDQEDEKIQAQMDVLSLRFVERANEIINRLEQSASMLFEVPIEHLHVSCRLRAESHLRLRVERVFYSLDSFLLLLPGFLQRPAVLRRMRKNVPLLLEMNAGRIRYDYLERLQASMKIFGDELRNAVRIVTDSLKATLYSPSETLEDCSAMVTSLEGVIRNCMSVLE